MIDKMSLIFEWRVCDNCGTLQLMGQKAERHEMTLSWYDNKEKV
jgi:hypothetical protein